MNKDIAEGIPYPGSGLGGWSTTDHRMLNQPAAPKFKAA
jgi:hypothetical protein